MTKHKDLLVNILQPGAKLFAIRTKLNMKKWKRIKLNITLFITKQILTMCHNIKLYRCATKAVDSKGNSSLPM